MFNTPKVLLQPSNSLSSPVFQELGPDARSLLEVITFLPQGVNENNAEWLSPTISNIEMILDGFCILSLAYRNNGFIAMLAPLRDHLRPKDPGSSPLLNTTKEIYFARLSGEIPPGKPGFEEGRWITTEDVNIEHLLDVFTTIDANAESVWDACIDFMAQLYQHKSRPVTLGPKVEALADDHPSKAGCLKLWREQGDLGVAQTLGELSDANMRMGLDGEGVRQAKEASEVLERLGNVVNQAISLIDLARLLCADRHLDADRVESIFSRSTVKKFGFTELTAFLAIYINPRAKWRRPFTIWR